MTRPPIRPGDNLLDQVAFIFGDPQLDAAPGWDRINQATGRSTRFDETAAMLKATAREAWDAGARVMIMLGDATEYKDPGSVVLAVLADVFADWISWGGVVYAIAGNHDGNEFSVSSSSLEPLAKMARIRPDAFHLYHEIEFVPEINTLMVPYIHGAKPEDIAGQMYLAMPDAVSGPVLAATHYANGGAKCGPHEMVAKGDYLGAEHFENIIGLDQVIAGHIHQHGEGAYRMPDGREVPWGHPGSTTVQDMGERNDKKGYYLLDLKTRVRTFHEIRQPRGWWSVEYRDVLAWVAAAVPAPWGPNDIVRITGTCARGDFPASTLEEAFTSGALIRPWKFDCREVRPEAEARQARDAEVTRAGGIRQALVTMVRNAYPSDKDGEEGVIAEATDAALAVLRDQSGGIVCSHIWPESLEIEGHRTFLNYRHDFRLGDPLCITGLSGDGKSNFFDAMAVNITGRSFKNPDRASVVPRHLDKAKTVGIYAGVTPTGLERFRITREITIKKKGGSEQDLRLERWSTEEGPGFWDGGKLNDGGVPERQARIDTLFGGSHLGLMTTNFFKQKDRETFLLSKQSERKAVLLDAIGLSSLIAAFNILDKRRLAASSAALAARSELSGMNAATQGAGERVEALCRQGIADTQAAVVAAAEAAEKEPLAANYAGKVKDFEDSATEADGRLKALPNAEADHRAAQAEKEGREREFARQRETRLGDYKRESGALASITAELAALPAAQDIPALRADAERRAALEASLTADVDAAFERLSNARADFKTAQAEATRLRAEHQAHSGADIGKCSKCNQAIDSTQVEALLAKLVEDVYKAQAEAVRLEGLVAVELETHREAVRIRDEARIKAGASLDAVQLVERVADKRQALETRELELTARVEEIKAAGIKAGEDFTAELEGLEKKVADAAERDREVKLQALAITAEIAEYRAKAKEFTTLSAEVAAKVRELRKTEADMTARVGEAEAEIARIDALREKMKKAEADLPGIEKAAKVAELAAKLIDPRTGLPNYLIDEAAPALEAYINGYLDQLRSDGLRVKIQSPADKPDDLDILVDNGRPGRMLDVLDFSGGQHESLELASKMGVADIKTQFRDVTFGMRFYDEPITGLDAFGKAAFLRIISNQMTAYPVTAITSHDPEIVRGFPYRMNFEAGAQAETVAAGAA